MKKTYLKPDMQIVQLLHHHQLLHLGQIGNTLRRTGFRLCLETGSDSGIRCVTL